MPFEHKQETEITTGHGAQDDHWASRIVPTRIDSEVLRKGDKNTKKNNFYIRP